MSKLVDRILDAIPYDVFSDSELVPLFSGFDASRYNQVKRALANGEIILIKRGLYALAKRYRRRGLSLFEIAQKIYGPSYVSFESALSHHGLIPEAVYAITSATVKREKSVETPLGNFYYSPIPIRAFMVGVERVEDGRQPFLMASPLKALADYVYKGRHYWTGVEPLVASLRIELEDLHFQPDEIGEIKEAYSSTRMSAFLDGIKKDLHL